MIQSLVLVSLSYLSLAQDAAPPRTLLTLSAPTPGSSFGAALACTGDLDGDGIADLAVGSPGSNTYGTNAGNVRIYSGRTGVLLREMQGQPATRFGEALANPGDVDDDGHDDLLIGAPYASPFVHLFSGKTGALLFTLHGARGSRFGSALAGAGDVDGDGVLDVAVGEPQHDAPVGDNAGRVSVFSGATGELVFEVTGSLPFDQLGMQIAGAGDVDGDGHADLHVAAPFFDGMGGASGFNVGRILLLSGATGSPLSAIHGELAGDRLGTWLAVGADVDGDGIGELACGAPGADGPAGGFDSGVAQLRSGAGGELLLEVHGPDPGGFAGVVAAPMDVDGDGVADLVFGAPSSLKERGRVRVSSGEDGSTLHDIEGPSALGWFGASLCTLGDADGDGRHDLAIGAPGHEDHTGLTGKVVVVSFSRGPRPHRPDRTPPPVR